LLRHAKSSWDDAALADFDRPLATRGLKAGPRMGKELARRGWLPDAALVSAARRTRQTWDLVASELPGPPKPDFRKALYDAPAGQLLAELRGVPDSVGTLLMVAHNPGLQDLALDLADDGSDISAAERLRAKLPTGALARFVFDGKWNGLGPGTARLTHFIDPKSLKPAA